MSFVILFLLLPSVFSLLLYLGLGRISSRKVRTLLLFAMSALFFIFVIVYEFLFSGSGITPVSSIVVPFTILAFAIACPVAIGMTIFPGIFSKKGELVVAILAPFISIPFVAAMLLSGEAWAGKMYGDLFTFKLPLIGWIIDPFTHDWTYSPGSSPFPGLILYLGFFIEMTIVMLLFFWYCRTVGRSGSRAPKNNDP